jgi:O-methyltransferase
MDNTFIATYFNWDHRTPQNKHRYANKILNLLGVDGKIVPKPPDMANIEARMNIFHLMRHVAVSGIPGDVVEVGCNAGESSIVIQKVLNEYAPEKEFHVYDSFEGVPEVKGQDAKDNVYTTGSMSVSESTLYNNFAEVGLTPPHVHKGWFEDTVPSELPDQLSFAIVDGDLYSSTKHILPYVYERLSPGGICLFGIYYNEAIFRRDNTPDCYKSPGASKAIDEFFADKPESVSLLYANEYSNGYFQKE